MPPACTVCGSHAVAPRSPIAPDHETWHCYVCNAGFTVMRTVEYFFDSLGVEIKELHTKLDNLRKGKR